MNDTSISVVIPCLNEEDKVERTMLIVHDCLSANFSRYEMIVVDSGSDDRTVQIANETAGRLGNARVIKAGKRGKGLAVRSGMLEAEHDYVLFTDADLSTPIAEAAMLIGVVRQKGGIAIGSRKVPGARVSGRSGQRRTFSFIFYLFSFLLFGLQVHDSQCGFKLFERKAARELFSRQRTDGYLFDLEVLCIAKKKGIPVTEAPVVWEGSGNSRLNLIKEMFAVPCDLIRIKLMHDRSAG